MEIDKYIDIREKALFYNLKLVETKEQLDEILKTYSTSKSYFYRGVSQATYKLYTSGQRFWKTYDYKSINVNYLEFVKKYSTSALEQNNGLLKKYFDKFSLHNLEIAILSYIQHYGGPTPLLDFTTNLYKALFFCIDNAEIVPTDNTINNYVSLYIVDQNNIHLIDYQKQLSEIENSVYCNVDKLYKSKKVDKKTHVELKKAIINSRKRDLVTTLNKDHLYLIKNCDSKISFNILPNNNLNIISQDGVFILNPDDSKPLEEIITFGFIDKITKKKAEIEFLRDLTSKKNKQITCIEIHKRLLPHIDTILKFKRINRKSIYPMPEVIIQEALRAAQQ